MNQAIRKYNITRNRNYHYYENYDENNQAQGHNIAHNITRRLKNTERRTNTTQTNANSKPLVQDLGICSTM